MPEGSRGNVFPTIAEPRIYFDAMEQAWEAREKVIHTIAAPGGHPIKLGSRCVPLITHTGYSSILGMPGRPNLPDLAPLQGHYNPHEKGCNAPEHYTNL